jgi:hypothetical protein
MGRRGGLKVELIQQLELVWEMPFCRIFTFSLFSVGNFGVKVRLNSSAETESIFNQTT